MASENLLGEMFAVWAFAPGLPQSSWSLFSCVCLWYTGNEYDLSEPCFKVCGGEFPQRMYYQSFDTLASFSPIAHLLLTTNRQVLRSEVSLPAFFGGVSGLQQTPGHDAGSSQQENLLPPWTMAAWEGGVHGCHCWVPEQLQPSSYLISPCWYLTFFPFPFLPSFLQHTEYI